MPELPLALIHEANRGTWNPALEFSKRLLPLLYPRVPPSPLLRCRQRERCAASLDTGSG
ncbi:hypothetical protein [Sorangium sp. So ce1099]|uniref:hypothetical protein n=1 Tax=Sorangium sp. So ce1099 TaxID=3133331 RepID=UPI003F62C049